MRITIKRIDSSLPLPEYASPGACAFDLYARVSMTIEPNEIKLVPSNLVISVPAGHTLLLVPRSSLAGKKGLTMPNSIGVIDQDFGGNNDEIMVQLLNISKVPTLLERGERIAQALLVPIIRAQWDEVSATAVANRGGFGATGGYTIAKEVK